MNNSDNNKRDNSELFFKIFRNKYIKNQIFNQLQIYRNVSKFCRNRFNGFNQDNLKYFKFRDYILEMKYNTITSTKQRSFFNESDYQDLIVDESLPILPGSIPTSVEELHLNSNQLIIEGSIPNSVKILVIGSAYKKSLPVNVLPSSIDSIILNRNNNEILKDSLPSSCKRLIVNLSSISTPTNSLFKNESIPNSLESLQIIGNFQQELSFGIFSTALSSLTYLDLGSDFNAQISSPGILPSSLRILKWGKALILPNVIPNGVEFIQVATNWNQKIQLNTFPPSLKVLKLGSEFNTFINDNILPQKLEYLKFGTKFDQPIKLSYLGSLKVLILGWNFNRELIEQSIPELIEYIRFGKAQNRTIKPKILPSKSLSTLYFSSASLYSSSSSFDQGTLIEGSIPSSVKSVIFENGFGQYSQLPLHFIPLTLQYLDLGFNFNSILKREHFSSPTLSSASSELKVLVLNGKFNIKLTKEFYLPSNLVSLKLGGEFDQEFDKESVESLPKSLIKLELGSSFNQKLKYLSFTNIQFLIIRNQKYSHFNKIPSNIKYISKNGLFSSVSQEDQVILSTINKYESSYEKPKIILNHSKYLKINTKINEF